MAGQINIMKSRKFSSSQRDRISEIFGNISVAWFTAGVISPLFIHPANLFEFFIAFGISLFMFVVFLILSLIVIKGIK